MTEALEQQREETASVETAAQLPADTPAPPIGAAPASSDEELDQLLADFDKATTQAEPEPEQLPASENGAVSGNEELDKLLAELSGPTADQKRIGELEGEIGSLRAAELERQSRVDFEGFSKKLQAELGPNVDDQFARTNLLAMAAERPELEAVWRFRHLTDADRRAADAEFRQLEVLYHRAQQASDDPRKAQAMAQMERRGQELGLMMNAHKILNNVWRDVVHRARSVKPQIDEEQTALHLEVAAAVRGASEKVLPERPPNFATMTDNEFREYTRKNFGF